MDKLQLFVLILGLIATAQSEDDESPDFCGEIIGYTELGESVQVTSPGYPAQYNIATSCILTLYLEISTSYVLGISQYIPSSAGCSVPYNLINSEGNQLPNQYFNCSTSNDRTLYTSNLVIETNSTSEVEVSLPAGSGDGFTFTFTVLPLLTMQPSDSQYTADFMSTQAAYITSHQGFGEIKYRIDLRNQLILQNLTDVSAVTIDFIYFNLGTLASCAGQPLDVLKVYGNEESYPLYDCGDTYNKPPQQILDTRSYNSLLFEFVTNGENGYDGFLIQYSVTTGTTTTASSTGTTIAETASTSVPAFSSNAASSTTSTTQPMASTIKSKTSIAQPTTSTPQPTTSTTQPTTSTPQPTTSTTQPTTSTTQPTTSTPQPTTSTPQPTTSTSQPTTSTTQPTTSTTQPTTSTPQPTTSTTQPTTSTPQPTTSTPQPATSTPQPMTSTTQSMTSITQPTSDSLSTTTNTTTTNGTQPNATKTALPILSSLSESTPSGDHETSTNNNSTTVQESTSEVAGDNSKILQVAIGAGSGTFLLIVVAIILGCILGRRYNDSLSSKKRANMNTYEETDHSDGDQTRPIPGRVGVDPFNQYSEVDLSCYASSSLPERMAESVEPIPDPTNHYFTIEEPDGANSAGTGTPYTDSQVRYADNDQMPMSTFRGGTTSPAGMEPNPDADEPEVSTNLRFPAKTRPDPANQYPDIDLSPAPANEMEDTSPYWEIERTNDGQMNTSSGPHQTAEATRPSSGNVYHDVEPSISSEREFKVDEEPGTSTEEPATEGSQRAPVYSMIHKNPVMVDNSLYEAN